LPRGIDYLVVKRENVRGVQASIGGRQKGMEVDMTVKLGKRSKRKEIAGML
jgi:hypothetical protein